MRFNCTHTFTIEADDPRELEEALAHYRALTRSPLPIEGYSPGVVFAAPQLSKRAIEDRHGK
jgi:hypothetical protein